MTSSLLWLKAGSRAALGALARKPCELVIPDHFLGLPAVDALPAVLRTRSLRTEIEALGGYDTTQMGEPA